MPIEIIIRNIKRSIRDYRVYFYTLILFAMIFYVFNSFDVNVPEPTLDIGKVNIFVSVIFAFLLFYANLFMIRQRRPEFMTLSLLGMDLQKIFFILCVETCVVIIFSLVIALPGGIMLSQLVNLYIRYYMYGSAEGYVFSISTKAILGIVAIYMIIILLVCLLNILFVGRIKFHLLLKEDYVRSKRISQSGYLRPIIYLIISLALAGINRFLLVGRIYALTPLCVVFVFVFAVISIYLMTKSAFMLLNAFASSEKGYQYVFEIRFITDRGRELISFMTGISVVFLASFVLIAGSFGIINNLRKFSLSDQRNDIRITDEDDVMEQLHAAGTDTDKYFSEAVQTNVYVAADMRYSDMLRYTSYIFNENEYIMADANMTMITESAYNRIAVMNGMETLDLADDEFLLTSDVISFREAYNRFLDRNREVVLNGHTLRSKSSKCEDITVFMNSTKVNSGLFIVPDNIVDDVYIAERILVANYSSPDMEEEFLSELSKVQGIDQKWVVTFSDMQQGYRDMTLDILYICFYTSCILIICSMAVLSFKEMITIGSRSSMLKSLTLMGFPPAEVKRYFVCHITTIFSIPTIAAFIHSGYMIRAINHLVESVGVFDINWSYFAFTLILIPMLSIFAFLTYKTAADLSFRVRSNSYGKY